MLEGVKFVTQAKNGLSVPAQNTAIAARALDLDNPSSVPIGYFDVDQPRMSPHENEVGKGRYGMACLFILIAKNRGLWNPNAEVIRLKIDDEMMGVVYAFVDKEAWNTAIRTKGEEHHTTRLLILAAQADDQWVALYPTNK